MYTGYVKEGVYQPGDAGAEEKEDTDADNDADGESVKPTSTTSASIAPPSSVVTPVVFLVNGKQGSYWKISRAEDVDFPSFGGVRTFSSAINLSSVS